MRSGICTHSIWNLIRRTKQQTRVARADPSEETPWNQRGERENDGPSQ